MAGRVRTHVAAVLADGAERTTTGAPPPSKRATTRSASSGECGIDRVRTMVSRAVEAVAWSTLGVAVAVSSSVPAPSSVPGSRSTIHWV